MEEQKKRNIVINSTAVVTLIVVAIATTIATNTATVSGVHNGSQYHTLSQPL
jgi:hypothetical protein